MQVYRIGDRLPAASGRLCSQLYNIRRATGFDSLDNRLTLDLKAELGTCACDECRI